MTSNQNAIIKIITNDDVLFRLYYFTPEFEIINFLKPILYNLIDDDEDTDGLNWKDIIGVFKYYDLDPEKTDEPISLKVS